MKLTFKHILIFLFLLTTFNVTGQDINTVYQNILVDFYKNQLNDKLFDNECTGLKFNKKYNIVVNLDSTLWTIDPTTISYYFDIPSNSNIKKPNDSETWAWLANQTVLKDIKVDLSKFSNFERTSEIYPSFDKNSRKYFMRLSYPEIWDSFTYIELWIKYDYYSSGSRILYQVDSLNNIIRIKKYIMCDDNG